MLQDGVFMGPLTVQLGQLASASDALRPQTTTGWSKGWTETAFDFPHQFIDRGPVRILDWDPIDSYSVDQNTRFVQRYFVK